MCECADKVDAMLAESNTTLDRASMVNMESGKCRQSLIVATVRLDSSKKHTKVKRVIPSFCPFCGKKIETTNG